MIARYAELCDQMLVVMARKRGVLAVGFMMAGIILLMVSFSLKLHDVEFAGKIISGDVSGLDFGVVKQVGYVWAPNWALASIIILPFAIYNLLAARASAEMILPSLLERGMVARRNNEPIDPAALLADWRRTTRVWSVFTLASIVGIAVFIITTDFLPVVGNWLSSEEFRTREMVGLTIAHPDYEFDWSIAALYPGVDISNWANYLFSLGAYLLVPIFGAGLIFGMFIWFVSVSNFFSYGRLREQGYVILPDLESRDPRQGFEVFEDIFDNLLRAGLMTAALALCMHYQNVFLRTPSHKNIVEMLFADAIAAAKSALQSDFSPLMNYFVAFDRIVYIEDGGISLQTYATAIVNMLVFAIIMGLMWRWLRKLALGGLEYTARNISVTPQQEKRLEAMEIWPVGWMSATLLTLVISLTLAAMYFINLLPLIIVVMIIYGAKSLVVEPIGALFGGFGQSRRNLHWRRKDDDDE